MQRPKPNKPGPGQESVWDYPRPPRLEPVRGMIIIEHGGRERARTAGAYRVLETSHPPTYYLPPGDLPEAWFEPHPGSTFCEWKGAASYFDVVLDGQRFERVAWTYRAPTERFSDLRDYIAMYAQPFDRITVNGDLVTPQPGGFYGGWVTDKVVGPFKGGEGSWGW